MYVRIQLKSFLRPSSIALTAVLVSFSAWLTPSFGVLRKGFTQPEPFDLLAAIMLFDWYALIFLSFLVGQYLGAATSTTPVRRWPSIKYNPIFYSFTVLSAIGLASTYLKIFETLSLTEAMLLVMSGTANELKESLYDNYSYGLVSLRYVVVYSAAIAIYRIVMNKDRSIPVLLNLAMLVLSSIISSRLIFVATIVTSLLLISHEKRTVRVRVKSVIILTATVFLVLSALNYSRNFYFYNDNGQAFWAAGLSEVVTYLGAPAQVSLGSAKVIDRIVDEEPESYRKYVDVEEVLNTNSAFVHMHEWLGFWSWLFITAQCLLVGFVFAVLHSFGKSAFLLPCGAILYASAELWRLNLFSQGIFIVWFVFGVGVPAIFGLLTRPRYYRRL